MTPSFGPWQVLTELGRGGFGIVYKVRHEQTGDIAAFKHIARTEQLHLIRRGFNAARQINHPGCVAMREWLTAEQGGPGFVMDYIDGQSLTALKDQPLSRILPAIGEICRTLDFLHGQRIIHRDLKPENILLMNNLAKASEHNSEMDQKKPSQGLTGDNILLTNNLAKASVHDSEMDQKKPSQGLTGTIKLADFDLCKTLSGDGESGGGMTLLDYATSLLVLSRWSEARPLIAEARELADRIKVPSYIFRSKVLQAKLTAADGDPASALVQLTALLPEKWREPLQAALHYELWRLGQDFPNLKDLENLTAHGQTALAMYQALWAKTPNIEYKRRAEELARTCPQQSASVESSCTV